MTRLVAVVTTALIACSVAGAVAHAADPVVLVSGRSATAKPSVFGGNHWGFSHLRWSRWGSATATAAGDARWSYPGGDGTHRGRVTLRFSKIARVCGHRTYTRVTFRTRGGTTGEGALFEDCYWTGF